MRSGWGGEAVVIFKQAAVEHLFTLKAKPLDSELYVLQLLYVALDDENQILGIDPDLQDALEHEASVLWNLSPGRFHASTIH